MTACIAQHEIAPTTTEPDYHAFHSRYGRGDDVRVGIVDGAPAPETPDDHIRHYVDPPWDPHGWYVRQVAQRVAPAAEYRHYVVFGGGRGGTAFDVQTAVRDAINDGCQVINLSLTVAGDSPMLYSAIKYALACNILVVAAAGNVGGYRGRIYPASYRGVIAVGATYLGSVAQWSSHPEGMDVVAVGQRIKIRTDNGQYGYAQGTSFAAPLVSGALACLLGAERNPRRALARLALLTHDVEEPGIDANSGAGIVDLRRVRG